jgi:hypothetical protein
VRAKNGRSGGCSNSRRRKLGKAISVRGATSLIAEEKIEKSTCCCKLRNLLKLKEIDEDLHVSSWKLIETEGNFTMEEEISGAGRDRFR